MLAKVLSQKKIALSSSREWIEFVVISLGSFFIPFLLAHPQMLVGVVVNILLVRGALVLKNEKILPMIFLPSLGVISRGLIFSSLSPFLMYMLPFIFLGNFILVYLVKRSAEKNLIAKLLSPALVKAAIIGLGAYLLIKLTVIPALLLYSMSVMQFTTALIALLIVYSIVSIENLWQSIARN